VKRNGRRKIPEAEENIKRGGLASVYAFRKKERKKKKRKGEEGPG